jgi:hypothetical protein
VRRNDTRDPPTACRCHASYTRPCPCCTCTRAKSFSACDPPHMVASCRLYAQAPPGACLCSLAEAKINGFKWTIPTHHTHVRVLVAHARVPNPSPRAIQRTCSCLWAWCVIMTRSGAIRRQAPGARRQLACRDPSAACRCHASYTRPCPCCTCTRAKSLSACDPAHMLLPVGMVRDHDQVRRHKAPTAC